MAGTFQDKYNRMRQSMARHKAGAKLAGIAMMQRGVGTAVSLGYGAAEARGYLKVADPTSMLAKVPKKLAVSAVAYVALLATKPGAARQALLGLADPGLYISAHQMGLNNLKVDAIARTEQAYGQPVEAVEHVRGTLGAGGEDAIQQLRNQLQNIDR